MKTTLLFFVALLTSFISISQTFTDGYFTYNVLSPDAVSLNDYDMTGGTDVTIPATVNYDGATYNVTFIGYEAFMSNDLTSVFIPEGVTTIVNRAFLWNNLTTLTLPNSVTHIYPAAFGSNELSSVTFGDGLVFIGDNGFNGNQLTSLEFPVGFTSIEKQVFANNSFTDLIIADGITAIGEGAFVGNPLVSVTSNNMTPPTIFTAAGIADSFSEDRSDICLIIPSGTEGVYVTDGDAQWTGFKSISFANMSDIYLNTAFNIFPNPAKSQLTIDLEGPIQNVSIINVEGKIIETTINPNNMIDISDLTEGIYFLQIQTDKGLLNEKFIKE